MTLSKGDGDIPSYPGRLLLIDEESSVGPSAHDLRDMHPSGTVEPISQACECKTRGKSPVPFAPLTPAQGIVGGHRAESTFR